MDGNYRDEIWTYRALVAQGRAYRERTESQAGCVFAIIDMIIVGGVVFWLLGLSLDDPWLAPAVIGVWTIWFALRSGLLYALPLGFSRSAARHAIAATAIHLLFAGIAYGVALVFARHETAVMVAAAACLVFSWAATGWLFDDARRRAEESAPESGEAGGIFEPPDSWVIDGE